MDVEVVGRLEHSDVFFDEEKVAVECIVHGSVVRATGTHWRFVEFRLPSLDASYRFDGDSECVRRCQG
jgi:hypothetical protein